MEQKHRDILKTKRVYLQTNIELSELLLSVLLSNKILSDEQYDEIKAEKTRTQKVVKMLDILPRCGPTGFRRFVEGLVEANIDFVADELDKQLADQYRKVKATMGCGSSWKTIMIFVSSNFHGFHQEREVLTKKVIPDLRLWCEAHRLRLKECDLLWGVPKDVMTEETLRACLGEIDQFSHDNVMPFFINMPSVDWVPTNPEVPECVSNEYKCVEGLSVTEMKIFKAAYRRDNPNALFMLREPDFIEHVPAEYKKWFIESNHRAAFEWIEEDFHPKRIHQYEVKYLGYNPDTKLVELDGLERFSKVVFDFFKERIAAQYPLHETINYNQYEYAAEQHESFMKNKAECVFGRDSLIDKIDKYICSPRADVPFLLVGEAGSGKSSIMALLAEKSTSNGANGKEVGVFYHFVGAVPGSTDLEKMLKRLLLEMKVCNEFNMPRDLENTAQMTCGALNNPNAKPTIVIIDALNQFDLDNLLEAVKWVPRKLASRVRCIFSMIPDTPPHKCFMKREPMPQVLEVTALDAETKENIVTELLGKDKPLDKEQIQTLLTKNSSDNPLWLSLAVKELRVFGPFRKNLDKINTLADGLIELEIQIIERFEQEFGKNLLIATLCLMEVSANGLLQKELLTLLANKAQLIMPEIDKAGDTVKGESKSEKRIYASRLPAHEWAEVYRNLKPFLRPFGDSSEGRLDFYHRSLSKAVRRKYFKNEDGVDRDEVYHWWYSKLADYFEHTRDFSRQVEEYPVHLLRIKDHERLKAFLTRWEVFDCLFEMDYSSRLVNLWRMSVGFEGMEHCYMTELKHYTNSGQHSKDDINNRSRRMANFFTQAGRLGCANELLKKCLKTEENELGARPEQLVDLYQGLAKNLAEIYLLDNYFHKSDIPLVISIIDYYEMALAIRQKLTGEHNQRELGYILRGLSYYYSQLKLIPSGQEVEGVLSPIEANNRARGTIEEAIIIFRQFDDEVQLASCLITKGAIWEKSHPEKMKCYKEAEEMLLRTVGEIHPLMTGVYRNIGVYYNVQGHYEDAFDYFYKWYQLCVQLYGKEHTRSINATERLREPRYSSYCRLKGIDVPEAGATVPKLLYQKTELAS